MIQIRPDSRKGAEVPATVLRVMRRGPRTVNNDWTYLNRYKTMSDRRIMLKTIEIEKVSEGKENHFIGFTQQDSMLVQLGAIKNDGRKPSELT
jgi:hypothetical protein